MGSVNFEDLDEVPEKVDSTVSMAVSNAVHLARYLQQAQYPEPK